MELVKAHEARELVKAHAERELERKAVEQELAWEKAWADALARM
jgi:hypothetical protein